MNIFVLDEDPHQAARYACDKHVVKMILETAQLLCAAYPEGYHCSSCGEVPYKKTHYNHPCGKWTRASASNFDWLVEHGRELSREYTLRYGKHHKSGAVIEYCASHAPSLPEDGLTKFAQAMPDEYKQPDPVAAYREYYRGEKSHFATWKTEIPHWWE